MEIFMARLKYTAATKVRSLKIAEWPVADRKGWEAACRPAVRLQRGGAASHMKEVTQKDLAKRYGGFLGFLARTGRFAANVVAAGLVTSENVAAYVAGLAGRVSSVTVYGSIQKLRRVVQLIAPRREIGWLIELERDLAADIRPRSKWDRIAPSDELVKAGLALVAEADIALHLPQLTRARMGRDGLMMSLLACCPIRLKNFAALEIGSSFVNLDGAWWIVLPGSATKEGRPDERPVPEFLFNAIQRYLENYRPMLARGNDKTAALWLAMNGRAMRYSSTGELITNTTYSTLGVKVSPHLFRACGATTGAIHAGDNPHLASALLHHRHPVVTAEHYNRATSLNAAKALAAVTRLYRQ
jgi:integrase